MAKFCFSAGIDFFMEIQLTICFVLKILNSKKILLPYAVYDRNGTDVTRAQIYGCQAF